MCMCMYVCVGIGHRMAVDLLGRKQRQRRPTTMFENYIFSFHCFRPSSLASRLLSLRLYPSEMLISDDCEHHTQLILITFQNRYVQLFCNFLDQELFRWLVVARVGVHLCMPLWRIQFVCVFVGALGAIWSSLPARVAEQGLENERALHDGCVLGKRMRIFSSQFGVRMSRE